MRVPASGLVGSQLMCVLLGSSMPYQVCRKVGQGRGSAHRREENGGGGRLGGTVPARSERISNIARGTLTQARVKKD